MNEISGAICLNENTLAILGGDSDKDPLLTGAIEDYLAGMSHALDEPETDPPGDKYQTVGRKIADVSYEFWRGWFDARGSILWPLGRAGEYPEIRISHDSATLLSFVRWLGHANHHANRHSMLYPGPIDSAEFEKLRYCAARRKVLRTTGQLAQKVIYLLYAHDVDNYERPSLEHMRAAARRVLCDPWHGAHRRG